MTSRSHLISRLVLRGVLGIALIDVILFGVAGRLDWRAAWVMSGMFAVYVAAGMAWFVRRDPDLMRERITRAANVPIWDRVIYPLYSISTGALLITAAVDAGRVGWSHVPVEIQAIGALGLVASFAVIWWCTAANHYLSSQSRIQSDRGHRVVREGPYAVVRHPMYASLIVVTASIALLLGSWLALVPALVIAVLLVIRTWFEDRMLRDELSGYREYALHVRQRLVPGVW
jgi:protein-S-isoprenylcysteine O-methyltransferase Ste14